MVRMVIGFNFYVERESGDRVMGDVVGVWVCFFLSLEGGGAGHKVF